MRKLGCCYRISLNFFMGFVAFIYSPSMGLAQIVWFQKISIPPPPRKVTGNSEGERCSKAEIRNFQGE